MTARPEFDPLDLLLIDYFELALDDARMRELSSLLAADPSARRRYIERSMIHSLLEWRSGGVAWSIDDNFHLPSPDDLGHAMVLPAIRGTDENDFESTEALNHLPLNNRAADVAPQNRSPRWLVKWWLIIAASFLLAVGVWALLLVRQDAKTSASAATIVGTEQAHWAHDQYAITNGTDIAVGRPISLESGWAELRLTSGTDMVVNGPAQLSINGPSLIHLSFGKLGISAAPLSHGLTVETRDARIRDLGTEFGVECEAGGKTVVEVFKGTVEASPVGSLNASLLLYTGDGARISNSAISRRPADAQPASFVLHLADQVMPADFSQFDVGQPSLPGSAQYHPDTDSWTISGNGSSISSQSISRVT
jgi:ferric-dicitrate binding protein FerR (iron transport regulator)